VLPKHENFFIFFLFAVAVFLVRLSEVCFVAQNGEVADCVCPIRQQIEAH
jgi:hypothetical protein